MTKPLALLYTRVSTAGQVEDGASLGAQETLLRAEADKRGWAVEVIREEGKSAKNLNRPELQAALKRLDTGKAAFLMSVRLDRVSRSVADFAGLLDRATKRGWGLVLLSPNIDTSDPAGRFTANVLASAAQYERELIGIRTREGMAQVRADRAAEGLGTNFGRTVAPAFMPTYKRILNMKAQGLSMNGIARTLNAEKVPTARGGVAWYPGTVKRVLESETAKTLG